MGQNRVIIENVQPQINGGQYPIKRTPGDKVKVTADIFADGHDKLYAELLWKGAHDKKWKSVSMKPTGNDEWTASFSTEKVGKYCYTIVAGIDYLSTWLGDLVKKLQDEQSILHDLTFGIEQLEDILHFASKPDQKKIQSLVDKIKKNKSLEFLGNAETAQLVAGLLPKYHEDKFLTRYPKELCVDVSRPKTRFSTWYERFPRSTSETEGKHGTFKDCVKLLPEIANMGFDVLYLPPIHPIGASHRKGRNNQTTAAKGDPGSPWAIGSKEGGHDAVHPQLGTLADYKKLIQAGREHGIEIAFDLAFQCSPDHPYISQHPEWFLWRPDGTVRYAENPPKKYEDIVPFYFECADWKALWEELKRVVLFWCEVGVKIFRVDNPHTKPFIFWEWLIREVRNVYPETIFLAEAFTRPKVMRYLAKIGFDQSYTYFTWRNTKTEIEDYLIELTQGISSEFFRPNFWPNTPDILPESLQHQGRNAFIMRLLLAATTSSNYGIYGPCFENMVNTPIKEGSEEYLDSEKYEVKFWPKKAENLKEMIALVNRIRKENAALQYTSNLQLIRNDNPFIISFAKSDPSGENLCIVAINLDTRHTQSGWLEIPLEHLKIDADSPYLVHDMLSGDQHLWQGEKAYVELNPHIIPAHIFRVRKKLNKENQFDYYT